MPRQRHACIDLCETACVIFRCTHANSKLITLQAPINGMYQAHIPQARSQAAEQCIPFLIPIDIVNHFKAANIRADHNKVHCWTCPQKLFCLFIKTFPAIEPGEFIIGHQIIFTDLGKTICCHPASPCPSDLIRI